MLEILVKYDKPRCLINFGMHVERNNICYRVNSAFRSIGLNNCYFKFRIVSWCSMLCFPIIVHVGNVEAQGFRDTVSFDCRKCNFCFHTPPPTLHYCNHEQFQSFQEQTQNKFLWVFCGFSILVSKFINLISLATKCTEITECKYKLISMLKFAYEIRSVCQLWCMIK